MILGKKSDGSPRDYISYSAWSVWKKDKDLYRRRYYENEKGITTTEMAFGKEIAKMLEDDHGDFKHIPRLSNPEHKLEITIGDDVKLLAYLDSFDPKTFSFLEYKTGHSTKDGSAPWDDLKVLKHKQLDWYSMMIKEKYGKVNNKCELIWLETLFEEEFINYEGHKLSKGNKLKLTGRVEVFKRDIKEYQRKNIKEDIISVANEIAKDYENYIK